jgi:hypothetical protein
MGERRLHPVLLVNEQIVRGARRAPRPVRKERASRWLDERQNPRGGHAGRWAHTILHHLVRPVAIWARTYFSCCIPSDE